MPAILEHCLAEPFHAVLIVPHDVVRVREVDADVRDVVFLQRLGQLVPVDRFDQRVLSAVGEDGRHGPGSDEMKRGKAVRSRDDFRRVELRRIDRDPRPVSD